MVLLISKCYHAFKREAIDKWNAEVYRVPEDHKNTETAKMPLKPLPAQPKRPKLRSMDTYELKDTKFLWYPYIPVGVATLLYGPGGSGKSHIAVDTAARVSTGRGFPGQTTPLPPQNVLMMSAEDEPERVLGPRLVKAGADRSKIFVPDRLFTLDPQGLQILEGFLDQVSAGIVFIDPIVSYIGGRVDINRSNETREFTGALQRMAQDHDIPIIVVGHTRKGVEGSDADRAMGSADFVNAVRSALFTTTAPNGDRIMKHAKANYSPRGLTQGYAFGDNGFEWTGEYAEDGMKAGAAREKKHNAVKDWLKEALAGGPVAAVVMEQAASKLGFSHRQVVRGKVGVAESFLVTQEGKMRWFWKLVEPQGDSNGKDSAEADVPVMGSKWGAKEPGLAGRTEREIIARTEDRNAEHVRPVELAGPIQGGRPLKRSVRSVDGASKLWDDGDLEDWMKENL